MGGSEVNCSILVSGTTVSKLVWSLMKQNSTEGRGTHVVMQESMVAGEKIMPNGGRCRGLLAEWQAPSLAGCHRWWCLPTLACHLAPLH